MRHTHVKFPVRPRIFGARSLFNKEIKIMKDLFYGTITLIASVIISIIIMPVLTSYSIGYSIYWSIRARSIKMFFVFWITVIDRTLSSVGYALKELAISQDILWNVQGEMFEDIITAKEDTMFGDHQVTVSASIGKLEIENKLNTHGKKVSWVLSKVFMQKRHAIDSWLFQKAKIELRDKYFS